MSAAMLDVDGALARADRRYANRFGDDPAPKEYLEVLANAIRPLVSESAPAAAPSAADAELRTDNARLADELQAVQEKANRLTAELEEVRSNLDRKARLLRARDEEANKLTADLTEAKKEQAAARRALDEQAADLVVEPPHRHLYPVPGPGQAPEPCSCGQAYPRAVPLPDVDTEPEPDPWGGLLGQVRGELAGWPAA